MEITHKEESGILLVAIKGRLDGLTVPSAERSINEILERGGDRLLFDFSELEYLSSGGLRVILSAAKEIKRRAGRIVLCAMQGYVKEIFEVSGFVLLIPIKDTVESGIAELQ
jgi:anti-anti-sigma factor